MKGHEYKYSFKNQFRTMASMSVYRTEMCIRDRVKKISRMNSCD